MNFDTWGFQPPKILRLLVCGSRDWTDVETIGKWLLDYKPDVVIHGNCRGADKIAGVEARKWGCEVLAFPAQWKRYGSPAAGPIRNQQMLDEGKPNYVVAFHENLAESTGTADMLRRAAAAGIPFVTVTGKEK